MASNLRRKTKAISPITARNARKMIPRFSIRFEDP